MTGPQPPAPERGTEPRPERPVVDGLIALVGVAVIVGLILGFAALLVTQVLGLAGDSDSTDAQAQESLYLPRPSPTDPESGPLVTLAPNQRQPEDDETGSPGQEQTEKKKRQRKEITLQAGQREVTAMGRIDLTGLYPGGEGAILQVQRFVDGDWVDFPATTSVSNETFSTYVQTGQPGKNRFRVVDNESGRASNDVSVKIG